MKGNVKIKDWYKFFRYGLGIWGIIIILLLSVLSSLFFISISYVIGEWTKQDKQEQRDIKYFNYFWGAISLFILSSFVRGIVVSLSCMMSSINIHKKMVWKLLRAPIFFFDSNSIGSILTRFSKDISVSDFMLPMQLNFLLNSTFKIMVGLVFIWITLPWNLIIVITLFIPMYWIRKFQRLALNDTQRVESISKGPVNTRYSSALDGLTTIRAYKKSKYFIDGFMKDSDLNASAKFTFHAVSRWLGIRLNLCSFFFVLFTLIGLVILK